MTEAQNHNNPLCKNALVDRLATRFGAFAIVATVTFPLQETAQGFSAVRAALGENAADVIPDYLFYSITILATSFVIVTLLLMFSVLVPLAGLWREGPWWHSILWVLGGAFAFVAMIAFMVTVMMTDQIKDMSSKTLPEIERVLETCREAEMQNISCAERLDEQKR